jgi:hypothetical protein
MENGSYTQEDEKPETHTIKGFWAALIIPNQRNKYCTTFIERDSNGVY